MKIDSVAVDYLRLASWKTAAYTKILARIMKAWEGDWEQGKWLQYKGWRKEGFFIGHGQQKKKSHTIINVSGELSHRLLPTLLTLDGWYCTRIDLQVTVDHPMVSGESLATIRAECTTDNTTLIESKENDTLYLGSRTSETFTRLYEKFLDSSAYLRLEFELKGCRSRQAWKAILEGETLESVYAYYRGRSKLPAYAREWFNQPGLAATKRAMTAQRTDDALKKLEWVRSLDGALERLMGNHDVGDEVKTIVRSWALYADKLDNNEAPV